MSNSNSRPGPDSTLEQTKTELIAAAISLLSERGIEVGLSHISLSDAITHASVTRSTAYRSLANDELGPQATLHREVLLHLLDQVREGASTNDIHAAIATELELHADAFASGSVEERTFAMRSMIRVGANASFDGLVAFPDRAVIATIYGALQSEPALDWRHQAVASGEQDFTEMFSALYRDLANFFDYTIKPGYTMHQFTTLCASLAEGLAMRTGFNDQVTMFDRPTGINGENEKWSLFAIGFEALLMSMFEPRNPNDRFADMLNH